MHLSFAQALALAVAASDVATLGIVVLKRLAARYLLI